MFDYVTKHTLVPLVLRLGLAVVFIYHGLGKVNQATEWGAKGLTPPPPAAADASKAPAGETKPQAEAPPPPPVAVQLAVSWGELIGGIAMALGFLTRLAALGLTIIMGGAIYLVHWSNGFSLMNHGYEYNFVLIVLCVALMLGGGGTLAVDRVFRLRRRKAGE